MKNTAIFAAIISLTWSSYAGAQNDLPAPFGVHWGMSPAEVEKILPDFEKRRVGNEYDFDPEKAGISDARTGIASFTADHRLYKIIIVSNAFENDPYGASIRRRMDEIADSMGDKYGVRRKSDYIAQGYDGGNYRYGIKSGRSVYRYDWDVRGLEVSLSSISMDGIDLIWAMLYTELRGKAEADAAKKAKERDAF